MQLPLKLIANRYWAPFYLIVFAAILIIQLFLPPTVGLTDNGDFGRLSAGHGLAANYPVEERYFQHFTPDYLKTKPGLMDRRGAFYTGSVSLWAAEFIGYFKPSGHFDLRWVGLVHMIIQLMEFALLLVLVRNTAAAVRWVVPAMAIWIFGDVFYAAYLNTLYLDAMGFLCFLAVVLAMVALSGPEEKVWAIILFVIASLGFAESKPLNAPATALLGIGVAVLGLLKMDGSRRKRSGIAGALAALTGLAVTILTPHYYGHSGLVDTVMMRIAKLPNGSAELPAFGLTPSDIRYAGEDAFRPDGPGRDAGFRARFAHTTVVTLVTWYARHSRDAVAFLRQDLIQYAPNLRPLRELEKPYYPSVRSQSFCSWSDLQAAILQSVPALIPLVYFFSVLLSALLILYRPWKSYAAFGTLIASISVAGIAQFVTGSLMDAIETSRHLFMFHVTTDVLLLLLFSGALWRVSDLRR